MIEAALRECGGRVYGPSGAAAKLGIPRTTLESKIKSLKINKHRFKGTDALESASRAILPARQLTSSSIGDSRQLLSSFVFNSTCGGRTLALVTRQETQC